MSALAMATQINQKTMNPSAPPEKKRQVATAMKKGPKNEITGLTIMNPSLIQDASHYPNKYTNNYIGRPAKSDIDADSALNFKNQRNVGRKQNMQDE